MIPKTLHYFWFSGDEKPPLIKKCIDSWKIHCPDFKIIEWNTDNFNVHQNDFCEEAFNSKKWAFLTDFARLKTLYDYGGIYLDTDVELIKPLDSFLNERSFIGFEETISLGPHLIGSESGIPWLKDCFMHYDNIHFILPNGDYNQVELPCIITPIIQNYYPQLKLNNNKQTMNNELTIYPSEYFTPHTSSMRFGGITEHTYAIHHFAGGWLDPQHLDVNNHTEKTLQKGGFLSKLFQKSYPILLCYRVILRLYYAKRHHQLIKEIKHITTTTIKNIKLFLHKIR